MESLNRRPGRAEQIGEIHAEAVNLEGDGEENVPDYDHGECALERWH